MSPHEALLASRYVKNYKENSMRINMTEKELQGVMECLRNRKVKNTDDLVKGALYTNVHTLSESIILTYYSATGTHKAFIGIDKTYGTNEYALSGYVDNDNTAVYRGLYLGDGVILDGVLNGNDYEELKVTYKAYSERLEIAHQSLLHKKLKEIKDFTIQCYNDYINGIVPEVHIIGQETPPNVDVEVVNEVDGTDITSHADILKEYHSVVSEISEASRKINQNTRLEDLHDISETFMATKEKLKDLAGATATRTSSIFDKFRGISLIGKAITHTQELKGKTDSVQDNIDALFIQMHRQYTRLVQIGEGLQSAKKAQELQATRLEMLIKASDDLLSKYVKQSDVPVRELSANNQIKTSYEKIKKRILKTEAAIMGTQASIISLGKDLPCSKAEMTEELSLSSLLNSVTDYQGMYNSISELLNEVVEVTSEKTYKVVENLMDMQINDTHSLKFLQKDNQRAKEFAMMLTDKSQKLANKVVSDATMIKEIASGTSILEASEKVKALGYNTGL